MLALSQANHIVAQANINPRADAFAGSLETFAGVLQESWQITTQRCCQPGKDCARYEANPERYAVNLEIA